MKFFGFKTRPLDTPNFVTRHLATETSLLFWKPCNFSSLSTFSCHKCPNGETLGSLKVQIARHLFRAQITSPAPPHYRRRRFEVIPVSASPISASGIAPEPGLRHRPSLRPSTVEDLINKTLAESWTTRAQLRCYRAQDRTDAAACRQLTLFIMRQQW